MTLTDLFDLSLVGRRDQAALEWDGVTYTFGEVDGRASRMAHALSQRGLRQGDRVCVYLPNSIYYIDIFLATLRLGLVLVPINVLYRDREIAHILGDADPVAVIAGEHQVGYLPSGANAWLVEELHREAERQGGGRVSVSVDADAPAAIVYTSGTTGVSKGAVISHNMFAVNAVNLLACWRIVSEDRLLLTLPLFHVHGLGNGLHCWLISGCHMRLTERFEHEKATRWLEEFRATLFFGVPTMYVRLLESDASAAGRIGRNMRLFVSGSAPLPAQVLEDFRRLYGHSILERYGMSETLMNMSNPYVGERRPGSVGLALPGVSVRNLDPDGNPVADGEVGELHLRGSNVFSGYWRREEATVAAFRDGWFRTGDLAARDGDGYYTLHGRRTDLIISAGFNIYPREIEELLREQPGVVDVAVAAVADPLRGEVPIAYVVPERELNPAQLEAACRAHLASFKVPRRFIAVECIPRTALGKIQKHLLNPIERP